MDELRLLRQRIDSAIEAILQLIDSACWELEINRRELETIYLTLKTPSSDRRLTRRNIEEAVCSIEEILEGVESAWNTIEIVNRGVESIRASTERIRQEIVPVRRTFRHALDMACRSFDMDRHVIETAGSVLNATCHDIDASVSDVQLLCRARARELREDEEEELIEAGFEADVSDADKFIPDDA